MDVSNANDLIAELDTLMERDGQGSTVKTADVKKLMEKHRIAKAEEEAKPKPKSMKQATAMARRYLREIPVRSETVKS